MTSCNSGAWTYFHQAAPASHRESLEPLNRRVHTSRQNWTNLTVIESPFASHGFLWLMPVSLSRLLSFLQFAPRIGPPFPVESGGPDQPVCGKADKDHTSQGIRRQHSNPAAQPRQPKEKEGGFGGINEPALSWGRGTVDQRLVSDEQRAAQEHLVLAPISATRGASAAHGYIAAFQCPVLGHDMPLFGVAFAAASDVDHDGDEVYDEKQGEHCCGHQAVGRHRHKQGIHDSPLRVQNTLSL